MPALPAVRFEAVAKTYTGARGTLRALDGVSFDISQGEFFGLLGPNGAGKTTLISVLAGLVRATSGRVQVLGHDVVADYAAARKALGIVPQELVFDPFFSVRETLRIQSGYFGVKHNGPWIDELLANLGLADMRRNIDAWWPLIERGEVEAIVMNASGCGATVKEYGHHLADDAAYAAKAARVSAMTRDLSELLPALVPVLQPQLAEAARAGRLALHPPCTLQHAQQLKGGLEAGLRALGFDVAVPAESHLCCGSAGTYSVLQPALSAQLRERKQAHLAALQPDTIVSANIGCITHLQGGCATPVRHWVEVVDAALTGRAAPAGTGPGSRPA